MALLNSNFINKLEKDRNTVHQTVRATYSVFHTKDGGRYFQIDTYGSENREFKEKISQSIQIDEETAIYLMKLIKEEFNL